jgi:hypothetical protein
VPLGKIAIVDRSSGRQLDGPAAMAALFRQVPAYWPLLLLLSVPGLRSMLTADLVSPAPV